MNTELKQIADLALFARIVQAGGISRCARVLGMERTTISRRLGSLERALGVKLLERSPRRVSVTEAGRKCFAHCEQLLQAAQNAHTLAAEGATDEDRPPLAVAAPPDVLEQFIDPVLVAFEAQHKRVDIERQSVCIDEDVFSRVDLVVTWGGVELPAAVSKMVMSVQQSLYASPAYVARRGMPDSPYELGAHVCVEIDNADTQSVWRFDHHGESLSIRVTPRSRLAGLLEAREAAIAGLGICRLPDYLCRDAIIAGRLEPVAAEYACEPRPLLLHWPRRDELKPGATTLRLYIEDALQHFTS